MAGTIMARLLRVFPGGKGQYYRGRGERGGGGARINVTLGYIQNSAT